MKKLSTSDKHKSVIVNCYNKGQQELKELINSQGQTLQQFCCTNYLHHSNTIAVVGAGMSAEREVSFMSANGVIDTLLHIGHNVIFIDMGYDIACVIHYIQPRLVFNTLHGTYGEDGCLPGLLNILQVPYTGPGVLASSLAFNKQKSYEIFKSHNITVADSIVVDQKETLQHDPIPRPYVIKPLSQGSSIGIEIIFKEDNFIFQDYKFDYGNKVMIQKYVQGRELQVAVLNGKAIGVAEIELLHGKRFYDYEGKYTKNYVKCLLPAPISPAATTQVTKIAEQTCKIFNCMSGIIRVEFIYNVQDQQFYILELNTHPGMTPLSICPKILTHKGISYTNLVQQILQSATFER